MRHVLLPLLLLATIVTIAAAAPTDGPWPRKKLIETGWDQPDTAALRRNLAEMEKQPFDGVVIRVNGKDDAGAGVSLRSTFLSAPCKEEWFAAALADLQAIKPTRLTDNFLAIGANPGNVDWFDDAGFANVVQRWRVAAKLAKQGGVKGLLFDPEPYTKPYAQFSYLAQPQAAQHTFAEYAQKARQRGREVMQAVAAEYPDCVLYCYFMNIANSTVAGIAEPTPYLASSGYGLYPAFIDGWLDVIPPQMTLIDGCENAYLYNSREQFLQAAVLMKGDCQSLVAPENRARYRAQVQTSFGIYLDAYVNPESSPWYIDAQGGPRVDRLRANLTAALQIADRYVWVYGEKYRWWETANGSVKPESWEQALPGADGALRFAADPDDYARARFAALQAAGKLVDLARNGDFASEKAQDAQGADEAYKQGGAPAGWHTWEIKNAGSFTWDRETGKSAPGSARAANLSGGCFIQQISPVKPGERYYVSAAYRCQGAGGVSMRLRWQTPEGKWTQEQLDRLVYPAPGAAAGQWHELTGVAEVPQAAGRLIILLGAAGQPGPNDVAWFDDVKCYRLD